MFQQPKPECLNSNSTSNSSSFLAPQSSQLAPFDGGRARAWLRGPSQQRELVALGVVSVEHLEPAGQGVLRPPVEAERLLREVSLPQGPPRVALDRAEPGVLPPWALRLPR